MPAGRAVLPQLTTEVLRFPFQAHLSRHRCVGSVRGGALAPQLSPSGDRALSGSRRPLLMHAAGAQEHATTDTSEGATGHLTPRGLTAIQKPMRMLSAAPSIMPVAFICQLLHGHDLALARR